MNEDVNADWPAIIAIAIKADSDLGTKCSKPGQRMRGIYWDSYRRACELGYRGSEEDWPVFTRARCRAARTCAQVARFFFCLSEAIHKNRLLPLSDSP